MIALGSEPGRARLVYAGRRGARRDGWAVEVADSLLFSLVASGQIKLRRIDGWRKIAAMLSQQTAVAA